MEVYFDNSSTTKPYEEVINSIFSDLKSNFGNPSSIHRLGIESERILKKSRNIIAESLGCSSKEIVFTSGGTESNNFAIRGIAKLRSGRGKHILSSSIEHDSVYNTILDLRDNYGYEVTFISPDENGYISPEKIKKEIREDTIFVSIIHVNNELGTINPVEEIGKIVKEYDEKIHFHVDAIQSYLKLEMNLKSTLIDSLSISAHKIHGPKGVGALFIKEGISIYPLITGGGQENGFRSGTENTIFINGFAKAVEIQMDKIKENFKTINDLKLYFKKNVMDKIEHIKINTPENSSSHIMNISFLGVKGEILLHSLEKDGIYVSTGSACSSKKKGSRVLDNIGLRKIEKDGAIRFSFSELNNKNEIDYCIDSIEKNVRDLRKILKFKP